MPMGPPIDRRTLVEQIRDRIREEMLAGRMPSGQLHTVKGIADRLGVSRTPVREALVQMAESGHITFHPNRGFTVNPVTLDDVVATFQLRLALEISAVCQAAGSTTDITALQARFDELAAATTAHDQFRFIVADQQFHDEIMRLGGNPRAHKAVNDARDAIFGRGISGAGPEPDWDDLYSQHHAIMTAVTARDPEAAAEALRAHLIATVAEFGSHSDVAGTGSRTIRPDWAHGWDHQHH